MAFNCPLQVAGHPAGEVLDYSVKPSSDQRFVTQLNHFIMLWWSCSSAMSVNNSRWCQSTTQSILFFTHWWRQRRD
uniref:Uncharacterized protein n=2 Tax=Anguilla anguilla TaxID=7936 RepID=A0A0E9Q9H3_ANGAN